MKTRKTGRVVRIEVDEDTNPWMLRILKNRWELDDDNIFKIGAEDLFDYTAFWEVIGHPEFKHKLQKQPPSVRPLSYPEVGSDDIFEVLKRRDILLHHPYNRPTMRRRAH